MQEAVQEQYQDKIYKRIEPVIIKLQRMWRHEK